MKNTKLSHDFKIGDCVWIISLSSGIAVVEGQAKILELLENSNEYKVVFSENVVKRHVTPLAQGDPSLYCERLNKGIARIHNFKVGDCVCIINKTKKEVEGAAQIMEISDYGSDWYYVRFQSAYKWEHRFVCEEAQGDPYVYCEELSYHAD